MSATQPVPYPIEPQLAAMNNQDRANLMADCLQDVSLLEINGINFGLVHHPAGLSSEEVRAYLMTLAPIAWDAVMERVRQDYALMIAGDRRYDA